MKNIESNCIAMGPLNQVNAMKTYILALFFNYCV